MALAQHHTPPQLQKEKDEKVGRGETYNPPKTSLQAPIASVTATSNMGATTIFLPCARRTGEEGETGRPDSLRRTKVSRVGSRRKMRRRCFVISVVFCSLALDWVCWIGVLGVFGLGMDSRAFWEFCS